MEKCFDGLDLESESTPSFLNCSSANSGSSGI